MYLAVRIVFSELSPSSSNSFSAGLVSSLSSTWHSHLASRGLFPSPASLCLPLPTLQEWPDPRPLQCASSFTWLHAQRPCFSFDGFTKHRTCNFEFLGKFELRKCYHNWHIVFVSREPKCAGREMGLIKHSCFLSLFTSHSFLLDDHPEDTGSICICMSCCAWLMFPDMLLI